VFTNFAEDEGNTPTRTVLMMKIGGIGVSAGIKGSRFRRNEGVPGGVAEDAGHTTAPTAES